MRISKIVAACISLLILQSCNTASPEYSPLVETSCEIPCWYDITPSVSAKVDAIKALNKYQLDTNCEDVDFGFMRGTRCDGAGIWFDTNDIVESITLIPDSRVSVNAVLQKFGEPDFVVIIEDEGNPEFVTISIEIYYTRLGLSMLVSNPEDEYTYEISPDSLIAHFTYQQAEADIESARTLLAIEHSDRQIFLWQGYGDYLQTSP
jgi:hypothetical protein